MKRKNIPEWLLPAGKFLLGFGALFILLNFLLSLIPLIWIELFYAQATKIILGFLGFSGEVVVQEPVLVLLAGFTAPLGFSYLCTGILELAIIWSAVLASFGISTKQRIIGAGIGAVVIIVFNFMRIISSVLIINYFGLDAGNFAHDLLFKIFLFIVIAGYYNAWFGWATATQAFNKV